MKKIILATVVLFTSNFIQAQKASDIFTSNTLKVSWLKLSFSFLIVKFKSVFLILIIASNVNYFLRFAFYRIKNFSTQFACRDKPECRRYAKF